MMLTRSDHRILSALQFVDAATGVTIANPIQVSALGVQFVRNRSGYVLAFAAPGVASLKDYGDAFDAPLNTPEVNSVAIDVQVTDPTGEYLPRRYILSCLVILIRFRQINPIQCFNLRSYRCFVHLLLKWLLIGQSFAQP
jgi:hypothetical protein